MTCILEDMECYYEVCTVLYMACCLPNLKMQIFAKTSLQSIHIAPIANRCSTPCKPTYNLKKCILYIAQNMVVRVKRHLGRHSQGFLVAVNRSPAPYQHTSSPTPASWPSPAGMWRKHLWLPSVDLRTLSGAPPFFSAPDPSSSSVYRFLPPADNAHRHGIESEIENNICRSEKADYCNVRFLQPCNIQKFST